MLEITKGYKEGRAVMYYDLFDAMEQKTTEKVHKDDVVKLCEENKVNNAKIQWWEGKPIVRVKGNIELVKLGQSGNVEGAIQKSVRNTQKQENEKREEHTGVEVSVADKAVVVGKLRSSRPKLKEQQAYIGYSMDNIYERRKLNSTVTYDGLNTLADLFDKIADEYKVNGRETYKKNFGKKIDITKKISGLQREYVLKVQAEMAVYLVNMAQLEIQEVYLKYIPSAV